MSENVIQTSFSSGELAPSIFARTDLAQYHKGAATMRNFFVDYRSGASTRPGTKFVIQALISTSAVRVVGFTYSNITTYVLEFGNHYIRFINNGAAVLETGFAITAASNNAPATVTAPGNNFSNGDWVFITGIGGTSQLNSRFYSVGISGSIVTLNTVNGVPVNSSTYGVYTSGGTISRVYKIASPYASTDLFASQSSGNPGLKFTQSANVLTITHPSYPPYNLTLTGATAWTLTQIAFGPSIGPVNIASITPNPGGTTEYSYLLTSVDVNGQESAPGTPGSVDSVDLTSTAGTNVIDWSAVTGAVSYNIYKTQQATSPATIPTGVAYGFAGSATGTSFIDSNIQPDYSTSPPVVELPFANGNNPGVSAYFQQRLYMAASAADPLTFWASQPGIYYNNNVSNPIQADDAITGTLVSLQVNAIKSMIPMPGGLVMLTAKGAWLLSSGSGTASTAAVTPINATAIPQAYNGASDLQPIISNYDIIYIQAKGAKVRDLSYNIYAAIYTGTDISLLSNHLFFNYQIVDWAFAEEPYSIIWHVRNDGILLSCTFLKEQELVGWARHDTLGLFQSVCSVTEGQTDATYVVVKRYIGGQWVQMIERFAERVFPYGAEDAWCVDCGIESAQFYPTAGLAPNVSSGLATFTATANVFVSNQVGNIIRIDGGIATVTQYISPTQVQGTWTQPPTVTLPNDPNNMPLPALQGDWSIAAAATSFTGLDYLEGQTVSMLADGAVIAPQVVTNGTVTCPQPASKVTVGLGYTAQLQTMPLDVGEPTVQGKRKKIAALTIKCANTRGLQAGSSFSTLVQIKEMNRSVLLGQAIPLVTGDERVIMDPLWSVPGQICIQQNDPLPATVLGVVPEIIIGDTPK